MTPSDVVIHGLFIAIPSFARWAIVLAVEIAMHVSHMDLDMTLVFNELEAHQTLKTIGALVDLIPEKELHAGGVIICKEGEQTYPLLFRKIYLLQWIPF